MKGNGRHSGAGREKREKEKKKKGKIYLPRMSVLSAIFLRSRGLMTRREDQHSETESARVDVPVIALKRSATKNNLYDPFFFPLSFFMRKTKDRESARQALTAEYHTCQCCIQRMYRIYAHRL